MNDRLMEVIGWILVAASLTLLFLGISNAHCAQNWMAIIHVYDVDGVEKSINIHYMDVRTSKPMESLAECNAYLNKLRKEALLPKGWAQNMECTTREPDTSPKRQTYEDHWKMYNTASSQKLAEPFTDKKMYCGFRVEIMSKALSTKPNYDTAVQLMHANPFPDSWSDEMKIVAAEDVTDLYEAKDPVQFIRERYQQCLGAI